MSEKWLDLVSYMVSALQIMIGYLVLRNWPVSFLRMNGTQREFELVYLVDFAGARCFITIVIT